MDLNVLLVGTNTYSRESLYRIIYPRLDDMQNFFAKKGLLDVYNNLYQSGKISAYYGDNLADISLDDVHKYYGTHLTEISIEMTDIPLDKRWVIIKDNPIRKHDLVKNPNLFVGEIKKIYPQCSSITYDTVDYYIFPKEFFKEKYKPNKIAELDKQFNKKISKKFNIQIKHNYHKRMDFVDYIKTNRKQYDIIWFFGCCQPSYVIDSNDNMYVKNFRLSLADNGYILHADPYYDGHTTRQSMISLIDRQIELYGLYGGSESAILDKNKQELADVHKFCLNLTEISTGVYQFK